MMSRDWKDRIEDELGAVSRLENRITEGKSNLNKGPANEGQKLENCGTICPLVSPCCPQGARALRPEPLFSVWWRAGGCRHRFYLNKFLGTMKNKLTTLLQPSLFKFSCNLLHIPSLRDILLCFPSVLLSSLTSEMNILRISIQCQDFQLILSRSAQEPCTSAFPWRNQTQLGNILWLVSLFTCPCIDA